MSTREVNLRTLGRQVVYVTPRGRLCSLLHGDRRVADEYEFSYLDKRNEGFTLRSANLRILRVASR
jgi:hypothetical protein